MMKRFLFTTLVLLGLGLFSGVHAATYSYYRAITVTSTNTVASGTLNNFPMLFNTTANWLKTTSTDAANGRIQNANGWDLVFTTSTPTASAGGWNCNKAPHEIESYASSTGNMIAWFLTSTTTASQVNYVCYGNSAATSTQEASSSVWDTNFKGVWHLPDGTTLSGKDSTSNNFALTNNFSVTATSGQIDGGANFQSPSQSLSNSSFTWTQSSSVTFSAWVFKPSSASGTETSIFGATVSAQRFVADIFTDKNLYWDYGNIGTTGRTSVSFIGHFDAWTYVTVTSGGGTGGMNIYFNGTLAKSTAVSDAPGTVSAIKLGNTFGPWNGQYDEAEISNVVRSSQWILTEYNNQNSPSTFYALGAEQTNAATTGDACFYWND